MKSYISIFKVTLMNNIQYRTAAIAGILTQVFFGLVYIMVYLAFYKSGTTKALPMTWKELASYLWLNQIFFTLIYIWQKDKNLLEMIKNGNISYELCRPINFYKKWYATMYGTRLAAVLLRFFPVLLVAFLLPEPYKMNLPINLISLVLFLISLLISSLLVTSVCLIIHIITMFIIDERGIMAMLMVTGEIFSGSVIPISFFPNFLKRIAYLLPFRYISDIPFRIYSGNISITNSIPNLINAILWLITMIILGYILSKKAIKKAIIQGG